MLDFVVMASQDGVCLGRENNAFWLSHEAESWFLNVMLVSNKIAGNLTADSGNYTQGQYLG